MFAFGRIDQHRKKSFKSVYGQSIGQTGGIQESLVERSFSDKRSDWEENSIMATSSSKISGDKAEKIDNNDGPVDDQEESDAEVSRRMNAIPSNSDVY